MPFVLRAAEHELTFFTTLTTFSTPRDVTLDERKVELFFPADDATESLLKHPRPWSCTRLLSLLWELSECCEVLVEMSERARAWDRQNVGSEFEERSESVLGRGTP